MPFLATVRSRPPGPRSSSLWTFERRNALSASSYIVGVVGTAVLTAPAGGELETQGTNPKAIRPVCR